MLQVRRPGTSSQEMYRYKPEMLALQGARDTVGAQDGGTGMRSSEEGNEKNQSRTRGPKWCKGRLAAAGYPDPQPASKDVDAEHAMEAMTLGAHHRIPLEHGNGYVVVEWAGMVYVSPNCGWAAFEEFLDGVGDCVRRHFPRHVLVLGNFNAHPRDGETPGPTRAAAHSRIGSRVSDSC